MNQIWASAIFQYHIFISFHIFIGYCFNGNFLKWNGKMQTISSAPKKSTQSDQEFPKIVFHFTVRARLNVVVAFLTFFASHSVTEFTRPSVCVWARLQSRNRVKMVSQLISLKWLCISIRVESRFNWLLCCFFYNFFCFFVVAVVVFSSITEWNL